MSIVDSLPVGAKMKSLLSNAGLSTVRSVISYVKASEAYFRTEVGGDVDALYGAYPDVSDKVVVDPNPPGKLGAFLTKKEI